MALAHICTECDATPNGQAAACAHHAATGHALRLRDCPHWGPVTFPCCSGDAALRHHLAGVRA